MEWIASAYFAHGPRLVALQLADEVPAQRVQIGDLGRLRLRLLVAVLAQVVYTERVQLAHHRGGWNLVTTIVVISPGSLPATRAASAT